MARYERLYRLSRFLQNKLPPPVDVPVYIRREKMPQDTSADCTTTYTFDYYWVRIDKIAEEDYALDLLIHEYAHILTWTPETPWNTTDEKDHDMNWGRKYSRVYRAYLKWLSAEKLRQKKQRKLPNQL